MTTEIVPRYPRAQPAPADAADAPERGAVNRGTPTHVLPNGEVRGSGAGAGGGGGREDPDTDDPTIAAPMPAAAESHPEAGADARKYDSA